MSNLVNSGQNVNFELSVNFRRIRKYFLVKNDNSKNS